MKRRIGGIIAFFACFLQVFIASAHPLDVSNTTMTIYEKSIEGVTYIHPVQLDRILVNNTNISPTAITVESYYTLTGVLIQYLQDTFEVENMGEKCIFSHFSFTEGLMIDEIFSGGFPISYHIECKNALENPKVMIHFLLEVPLQTNRLNIYKSLGGGSVEKLDYSVLNKRKDTLLISPGERRVLIDTDGDGLSDEDETLYATNKNNKDSDGDGYGDSIEIQSSWDPLTRELSPGQKPYDFHVADSAFTGGVIEKNNLTQDTAVWGGPYFAKVLKDIRMYIDEKKGITGFSLLLFSVFLLGFLHALGPGHSKGVLISQVLDKNIGLLRSISYAGVFSLVHILDIIFVVLLSRYFFRFIDPTLYLSYIQKGSIILILLVGIYLLVPSIQRYRKVSEHREKSYIEERPYKHLFLAVITGLTPCAFGWSIFLMLLAVNRSDLALPLLFSLGAGIFTCLSIIATITFFSKRQLFHFAPSLGTLSPIFSSGLLILIGFGLLFQFF